jgi:hypothetical protein
MSLTLLPELKDVTILKYPLKNHVYERVKQAKNLVDTDLLVELNKNGWSISMMDLNKVLLQLEIVGLITVHWMGKDKRRIEITESTSKSTE